MSNLNSSIEGILLRLAEREIRVIEKLKDISTNLYLTEAELTRMFIMEKIEKDTVLEAKRKLSNAIMDLRSFVWCLKNKKDWVEE